jgi:hypothetical protein
LVSVPAELDVGRITGDRFLGKDADEVDTEGWPDNENV